MEPAVQHAHPGRGSPQRLLQRTMITRTADGWRVAAAHISFLGEGS